MMKKDNEEYDNVVLTNEQLAKLYPLVKDFPEAPLNNAVLSTGLGMEENKTFPIFKALIKSGMIIKKYLNINVYKLTKKGLDAVINAYKKTTESGKNYT
jgi:DNA-binding Lrp family transcriptional regulator